MVNGLSENEADQLLESILCESSSVDDMMTRLREQILTTEQAIALDVAASTYLSGLRIVPKPKNEDESVNTARLIGELRPLITKRFAEILMPKK